MYDRDCIAERLDSATEQLGWRPEYHTVEEVDQVKRALDRIANFDDTGKFVSMKRPFTEREQRWIRNERMLCACDAEYFATRYAYIKDEKNNIKRFTFRAPQMVYFRIIAELERRGAAIKLQVLKARQLGMSTITEILVAHRIFFTYGVNAIIASAAQQQTQIMSQMIFIVYDNLPYWMQPPWTRRVESDKGMLVFGGIQSGVSFQHGSQASGIARGTTPTVVHLSEVATFQNPEDLIDASLFRAVHESPNVFMVLESTAEGVDNWWHRTWKSSKSGWAKGRANLCPLFLPWFLGTDIYPTRTWITTRKIEENWTPSRETRSMMAKAKMYVSHDPLLSEVLGKDWTMGPEQAWYWEVNYVDYKSRGREKLWAQEMPCDDIECFQSSFDSVFGNDLLAELHEARTKNYQIYAIEGQGIEDKFAPYDEDIDRGIGEEAPPPRRIVQYKNARGESYTWTLIPLLDSCIEVPDDPMDPGMENALEQADGKLLIFHEPRAGMDYTIGVDSGQGVGGDSTVISVWAKGKGGVPDIQCAEFSSNLVSHIEAYPFVMAIASLYMKHMDHPREPLVSIEVLAAVGDMVQLQMGKMGYSRFHQFVRYDSKKISKRKAVKRGWFTTSWSRPLLVDGFTHSVKNGWVEIHSPFLLAEMKNFEVHMTGGGKEKLEHADGSHDDRVFAGAIAVFTSHDLDAMVERGKKRYIPASQNYRPDVDIDIYNAGNFIGDQQFSSQIKTSTDLENLMADRFSY